MHVKSIRSPPVHHHLPQRKLHLLAATLNKNIASIGVISGKPITPATPYHHLKGAYKQGGGDTCILLLACGNVNWYNILEKWWKAMSKYKESLKKVHLLEPKIPTIYPKKITQNIEKNYDQSVHPSIIYSLDKWKPSKCPTIGVKISEFSYMRMLCNYWKQYS